MILRTKQSILSKKMKFLFEFEIILATFASTKF